MGKHSKLDHSFCRIRFNTRDNTEQCIDFHCPECGERVAPQVIPSECPHCRTPLKGKDHGADTTPAD